MVQTAFLFTQSLNHLYRLALSLSLSRPSIKREREFDLQFLFAKNRIGWSSGKLNFWNCPLFVIRHLWLIDSQYWKIEKNSRAMIPSVVHNDIYSDRLLNKDWTQAKLIASSFRRSEWLSRSSVSLQPLKHSSEQMENRKRGDTLTSQTESQIVFHWSLIG